MASCSSYSRRTFLRLASAAGAGTALAPVTGWGKTSVPPAPPIRKITILRVPGAFYRPIAMNAYDDGPKGKTGTIRLMRAVLEDGTVGLGVEGYDRIDEKTVAGLRERFLGTNPLEFYAWDGDVIQGVAPEYQDLLLSMRYSWLESALLDLVGKLKETPVYALFGDSVRTGVDAYDGTLYFKDVETDQGPEVIGELAARIKEDGYRALKMKVGRPYKWMEGEAGLQRDVAVIRAARDAVGSNFTLMADANNGYGDRFDAGVRLLRESESSNLYWMEELLPETKPDYRRLRRILHEEGIRLRLAEGENAMWADGAAIQQPDDVSSWFQDALIDVVQPDLRTIGITNTLAMADVAAQHGGMLVPHNWQSELGKLMGIHVSMLRRNVHFVEDDRWSNFALDASAYRFRNGQWYAPDAPGWGIRLSDHYDRFARSRDERVISL